MQRITTFFFQLNHGVVAFLTICERVNLNLSLCANHSSMVILKCTRLFNGYAQYRWLMIHDSLFIYSSFFVLISYANLCWLNQLNA